MNNDSLQIRFTDETYATRIDVARALGTNLIDQIWNNILAYRKQFVRPLNLNDISKAPLNITMGVKLEKLVNDVDGKVNRFESSFANLQDGSVERYTFTHDNLRICLSHIARIRNIQINDIAIGNIINRKAVNMTYSHLVNYYKVLEKLETMNRRTFSIDLIAEFLTLLYGDSYVNSFYRVNEINASSQRVLINKEYLGAPVKDIEGLMDSLVSFVNTTNFSSTLKAAIAYYMINYIKPFDMYNEEMAVIIAKLVLNCGGMEKSIAFLPIERFATQRSFEYALASKEVQKSKDTTYIAILLLEILQDSLSQCLDSIVSISIKNVGKAYLMGEDKEQIEREFGSTAVTNFESEQSNYQEPSNSAVEESQEAVVERPIDKKPPFVKQPKPVHKEQPLVVARPAQINVSSDLSEKELKKLEQDMIESDPTLRPAQAKFYVRHCTQGKYYTIEQYKKATGCVYETARTSMDTLAKKGYYQREKVNNKKFVYTPISK